MREIVFPFGPLDTADDNGICLTQTPAGAGNLTINGALATGGVATMDVARRVLITTAADETSKTFTITGTDWFGNTISEAVAGVDNTTTYTNADFKTVTQVAVSAATTGAIIVGTNGVASGQPLPLDIYQRPYVGLQVVVSGTINWTIQQTLDSPYVTDTTALTWFDSSDANLVAETVNRQGSYTPIPAATRIVINSGTGSLVYTIIESGLIG